MFTLHVELVAYARDFGGYDRYVFKDLSKESAREFGEFITCTKLPNWDIPLIKLKDRGYCQFEEVIAGESLWYDRIEEIHKKYKYDGTYLTSFVPEQVEKELIL